MATPTPTFDPNEDLYALLGVGIDSTDKEISSAYRKKARDVHPDKNPDPAAGTCFPRLVCLLTVVRSGAVPQAQAGDKCPAGRKGESRV